MENDKIKFDEFVKVSKAVILAKLVLDSDRGARVQQRVLSDCLRGHQI